MQNEIKKQADMAIPLSTEMGLGTNCLMLNVSDIAPQVSKINSNN